MLPLVIVKKLFFYAIGFTKILKLAELNIIGNLPTFIHLIEEQTDKKIDHNLHFMLWFVNKEAFVIDWKQGCAYKSYFVALKYSLQGTTQGRYLTGGVPPVRFSM